MITLTAERDYVRGDTAEWLADLSEEHAEAQEAFDAYLAGSGIYHPGNAVLPWLKTLGAKGLYGEDEPSTVATVNCDNWLSQDIIMTLAHTDAYDSLLIFQYGDYSGGPVHVHAFTGDDDADAYGWAGGYAYHADGSECPSEWILERACVLWPNGGQGPSPRLWDLPTDDEGRMLCPEHGKPLGFSA